MNRTQENEPDITWPAAVDQVREETARSEHLRIVVAQGIYILLGNVAAGVVLLVGAWGRVPNALLLIWFAVLAGFNVLRWAVGHQFPQGQLEEAEVRAWDRRVVAATFFSGCIWGIAGVGFFLPGASDHNLLLAILIIGMAAAAATSLPYHRIAYPAFFLPAVVPLTLSLMHEKAIAEKAVGMVLPLYFLLMYLLSRHIYQAAHAAILARINSERLAYYDALTGVTNRRAFEEVLTKEWSRALRYEHPLSLLVADIDDFKHFNDTYGHAVGDEVLHSVAQVIARRIRRGVDLAARIGGEEFALILPETDLAGAQVLAGKILRECQQVKSESDRHSEVITLSIGVSVCVPNEKIGVDALFEHADAALREAKRCGKNRAISIPTCST